MTGVVWPRVRARHALVLRPRLPPTAFVSGSLRTHRHVQTLAPRVKLSHHARPRCPCGNRCHGPRRPMVLSPIRSTCPRSAEQRARSAERLAELGSMTGGLARRYSRIPSCQPSGSTPNSWPRASTISTSLGGRKRNGSFDETPRLARGGSPANDLDRFPRVRGRASPRCPSRRRRRGFLDELSDFFSPQPREAVGASAHRGPFTGPLTASIDAAHIKPSSTSCSTPSRPSAHPDPASNRPRELILRTSVDLEADKIARDPNPRHRHRSGH